MDKKRLKKILINFKNDELSLEEALLEFKEAPFEDLGFAKVDHHRSLLQGTTEVIYGSGKTKKEIKKIINSLLKAGNNTILITRLSSKKAKYLKNFFSLNYNKRSHIGIVGKIPTPTGVGTILIVTGGTSDIPVAEEAALTAEALGNKVERLYDVGVAGLHRLLSYKKEIMDARCIIAVAGMEGALASVIGGLSDCPVIAVPTSVGYGASFNGVSALLSMLNSCASGVSVVNINNGFGAGYIANMINHLQ